MLLDVTQASADEILRLNQWQTNGEHPFTCPNRGDGNHREFNGDLGALVATTRGLVCPRGASTLRFGRTVSWPRPNDQSPEQF